MELKTFYLQPKAQITENKKQQKQLEKQFSQDQRKHDEAQLDFEVELKEAKMRGQELPTVENLRGKTEYNSGTRSEYSDRRREKRDNHRRRSSYNEGESDEWSDGSPNESL